MTTSFTPGDIAYDGSDFWITDMSDGVVQRFNPNSWLVEVGARPCAYPAGIVYDGTDLWATCGWDGAVHKFPPT